MYGSALRLIVEKFRAPLKAHKAIGKEDLTLMFGDIDLVYQSHSTFLAELEKEMLSETGRCVSKTLLAAVEPFRCYVRCAFFDRDSHSRMPLVPTPARLKRACV
jgi:hypothetical protein